MLAKNKIVAVEIDVVDDKDKVEEAEYIEIRYYPENNGEKESLVISLGGLAICLNPDELEEVLSYVKTHPEEA
jgi:hypothetical protein